LVAHDQLQISKLLALTSVSALLRWVSVSRRISNEHHQQMQMEAGQVEMMFMIPIMYICIYSGWQRASTACLDASSSSSSRLQARKEIKTRAESERFAEKTKRSYPSLCLVP
jgi:hypothetical protein